MFARSSRERHAWSMRAARLAPLWKRRFGCACNRRGVRAACCGACFEPRSSLPLCRLAGRPSLGTGVGSRCRGRKHAGFHWFSSRRGTRSSWPTGRTGWHLRPPRASRESCGSPCSTRRSRCSCGSLKGCNTRGHRLRRDLTEILDRRALDHRAVRREPRPVAWAIPAPLRSVPLHVAAEVGAGS
jgi:hypothetical protein